jgi:hypothetical protein
MVDILRWPRWVQLQRMGMILKIFFLSPPKQKFNAGTVHPGTHIERIYSKINSTIAQATRRVFWGK